MRPAMTFRQFNRDLIGKKVLKTVLRNGNKITVEVPKYILYWNCYNMLDIRKEFDVVDRI